MATPPAITALYNMATAVRAMEQDLAVAEARNLRLRNLLTRVVAVGDAMAAVIVEFRDDGIGQTAAGNAAATAWQTWRADQATE